MLMMGRSVEVENVDADKWEEIDEEEEEGRSDLVGKPSSTIPDDDQHFSSQEGRERKQGTVPSSTSSSSP